MANPLQMGCENIQERLLCLLQYGQWSDCKFLVGPEPNHEEIEGHKMILASASPVFEAMFFGELAESNPIVIPDIHPKIFGQVLLHIYVDHLPNFSSDQNSLDEAINVYYAAKKYILPRLVKHCYDYLKDRVITSNACRLYEFALLFDEKELENKCLEIMKSQTHAVITDSNFADVQLNTLIAVCSLEAIDCTELNLFEAVHKYAKSKEKNVDRSSCESLALEPSVSKDIVVRNSPEGALKPIKQDIESESVRLFRRHHYNLVTKF